jgi:predicted nuclease of predicted toxin-antitoxin system
MWSLLVWMARTMTVCGNMPAKVIQLRAGNGSTEEISALILGKKVEIRKFLNRKEESLLILH